MWTEFCGRSALARDTGSQSRSFTREHRTFSVSSLHDPRSMDFFLHHFVNCLTATSVVVANSLFRVAPIVIDPDLRSFLPDREDRPPLRTHHGDGTDALKASKAQKLMSKFLINLSHLISSCSICTWRGACRETTTLPMVVHQVSNQTKNVFGTFSLRALRKRP